jgi:hypothetical protein
VYKFMGVIERGAVNVIALVEIENSSTPVAPKSDLTYATASLACRYVRPGEAISGAITLEDITTLGTYQAPTSSSHLRFKAVDATNAPGLYELHIPNSWVNTTNNRRELIVILRGASGMADTKFVWKLTGANLEDSVRCGLTSLPAATAGTSGGLPTVTSNLRVKADLEAINNTALSAASLTLKQLIVDNSGGTGDAVRFTAGTNGHGMYLTGSGTGEALHCLGGANGAGAIFKTGNAIDGTVEIGSSSSGVIKVTTVGSQNGIEATVVSGSALKLTGGTNGHGIEASGAGIGSGLYVSGLSTGAGITAIGASGIITVGTGALGGAINAQGVGCPGLIATSTNSIGADLSGGGANPGVRVRGGSTGVGLLVNGGSSSGDAVQLTATSGDGLQITGAGGSNYGIRNTGGILASIIGDITGNVTGNLIGDVTGSVDSVVSALDVNATQIGGSSTAADMLAAIYGATNVAVAATGSTTTSVRSDRTEADDFWNGSVLYFITGANAGLGRRVNDYAQTNGAFSVTALPSAPANTDVAVLLGRIE